MGALSPGGYGDATVIVFTARTPHRTAGEPLVNTLFRLATFALAAAAAVLPSAAYAAGPVFSDDRVVAADASGVTAGSPGVTLREVGKEVEPGIFQVDPDALRGRRLIVTNKEAAQFAICIGVYRHGTCYGLSIWIKKDPR